MAVILINLYYIRKPRFRMKVMLQVVVNRNKLYCFSSANANQQEKLESCKSFKTGKNERCKMYKFLFMYDTSHCTCAKTVA